jgi:hypothetical protein
MAADSAPEFTPAPALTHQGGGRKSVQPDAVSISPYRFSSTTAARAVARPLRLPPDHRVFPPGRLRLPQPSCGTVKHRRCFTIRHAKPQGRAPR